MLSSPTAAEGRNPESGWKDSPAVDSVDPRSRGPGCAQTHPGTDFRGGLPTGVLRLPAEEVSARGGQTRRRSNPPGQDLRRRPRPEILLRYSATSPRTREGGLPGQG